MAPPGDPLAEIRAISTSLLAITSRGELGRFIATTAKGYGMFDLQLINGKIDRDLRSIPPPYRNRIRPFMQEWIFGRYHKVIAMDRSGAFATPGLLITNPDLYRSFCLMLPEGCITPGDLHDPYPEAQAAWYHCFMYLMAAFSMYVLDEPGHPAGMPFPGGGEVRRSGDVYYCPIRDKEEDIFYSICNYCPALQEPDQ